jgi:homoserine/homoserine lactone efflux protein
MSLNFIPLYITTVFIASIIPGPSMLLALTHGMQFGAKRAVASAMGNVTVSIAQAAVSFVGLGTILIASETAFQVIRFAGAAYLVYMGVGILLSANKSVIPKNQSAIKSDMSLKKMFLQSALVTAGNPKAIIFFTAIFPQFVDPAAPYPPQVLILLSLGSAIAFGCFMLYAISGQKIVSLFTNASIGKIINRIIGGTFIGAGIGLAIGNK